MAAPGKAARAEELMAKVLKGVEIQKPVLPAYMLNNPGAFDALTARKAGLLDAVVVAGEDSELTWASGPMPIQSAMYVSTDTIKR